MSRIVFLTCHLAGTGHLIRMLSVARAAREAGATVIVISGGRPLAHADAGGLDFVQLPPLTVRDLDFRTLLTPAGEPADEIYMAARRELIGWTIAEAAPDMLVTELFPLGRRRLAAEFEAAIGMARAANPRSAIVASVRDIPEPPSKPARLDEAADRLARFYDRVIVHGDGGLLTLGATWPLPEGLQPLISHCGYVGHVAAPVQGEPSGEILVSAGGGDRGRDMLELAARASARSRRPWHLLVGGADGTAVAADLNQRHGHGGLRIEPVRDDYRRLLARAACSVSLAGYNTVTDLAPLTTPAILIPDVTAGEREQAIRAEALSGFDGFEVLALDGLSADTLARTADAMAGASRPPLSIALDGAARAAEECLALIQRKRLS